MAAEVQTEGSLQEVIPTEELPPNVSAVLLPNAIVYLVGTAHVSTKSYEDVERIIRKARPDTVILELCSERRALLCSPKSVEKFMEETPPWYQVLRLKGISSIPQLILGSLLKAASVQLNVMPGGEFRVAAKEGLAVGAKIELGDRPIHITMARIWHALTFKEKMKLTYHCCRIDVDELTEDLIEKVKGKDMLEELIAEAEKEFPSISEPILHERDKFLTWFIKDSVRRKNPNVPEDKKRVIVAVMGLGHVAGVIKNWEQEIKPLPLLYSPPYLSPSNLLFIGSIVGSLLLGSLIMLFIFYRSVTYLWS